VWVVERLLLQRKRKKTASEVNPRTQQDLVCFAMCISFKTFKLCRICVQWVALNFFVASATKKICDTLAHASVCVVLCVVRPRSLARQIIKLESFTMGGVLNE
jgi:hypothetical protein